MIFNSNKFLEESSVNLTGNLKLMITKDDFFLSFMENSLEGSYNPIISPVKDRILLNKNISYFQNIFEKILNPTNNNYFVDSDVPTPGTRIYNYAENPAYYLFENTDQTGLEFASRPKLLLSSSYSNRFSYFAPLYIYGDENNIQLPNYFVVFRIKDFEFSNQYDIMNNDTNFKSFIKEKLKKSELVYSYKLKNSKLEDFLKLNTFKNKVYETIPEDEYSLFYWGFKIGNNSFDKLNRFRLMFDNVDDTKDLKKILQQTAKNEIINPNIFNLEFLFDYDSPLYFPTEDEFFGMYVNSEDLTELDFILDIDNLNNTLDVKIDSNKLEIVDEPYFDVIPKNEIVKLPIKIQDNTAVFNNIKNSQTLYLTQDNKKALYNISSIDTDSNNFNYLNLLSHKNINISRFYGFESTGIIIPGEVIDDEIRTNIRLKFGKESLNIFENSDYLAIKTDVYNNLEWRVIVNNDDEIIYDTTKPYYNKGETLIFDSESLVFQNLNSKDKKLTVTIPGFYSELEDFRNIKLTYNEYYKLDYTIFDVRYSIENNETTFSVIDYGTGNFNNSYLIQNIKFEYVGPTYYFTYFNSFGSVEKVMNNIVKAFSLFEYRIVDCYYKDGEIYFEGSDTGRAYNKIYLVYDFHYSNTNLNKLYINGKNPEIYSIKSSTGVNIFEKKYNKQEFFTFSTGNKNTFFLKNEYVSKIDNEVINPGDILIQCKNSVNKLKDFNIVNTKYWHSNYFKRFLDGNLYFVDTDKDDIAINSFGSITGLVKSTYTIEEISTVGIERVVVDIVCNESESIESTACFTQTIPLPEEPECPDLYRLFLSGTQSVLDQSGNSGDRFWTKDLLPQWTNGIAGFLDSYRPYGLGNSWDETEANVGRIYTGTYPSCNKKWTTTFWTKGVHLAGNVAGLSQISNGVLDNKHSITFFKNASFADDRTLGLNFFDPNGNAIRSITTAPIPYWQQDTWQMFTITFEEISGIGNYKIYYNNILIASLSEPTTLYPSILNPVFCYGTIKQMDTNTFRGSKLQFHKLRLWNRVLTPTEINTFYTTQI